jgi:hypothetical protein
MSGRGAAALMAFVVTAIPLAAQSKPIELGIDGGFEYKVNSPTVLQLGLPIQSFRVGFTAGRTVSIEPNVLVNYLKVEGAAGVFQFRPELGVLLHFSSETNRSRGYFRPFAGMTFTSFSGGGGSFNQFYLGGGVGVKVPVKGSRLATRFEGGIRHGLEGDLASATSIYALFGFSFFTK